MERRKKEIFFMLALSLLLGAAIWTWSPAALPADAQAQVEQKWETFQENTQKLIAMHAELQSLLRRD